MKSLFIACICQSSSGILSLSWNVNWKSSPECGHSRQLQHRGETSGAAAISCIKVGALMADGGDLMNQK